MPISFLFYFYLVNIQKKKKEKKERHFLFSITSSTSQIPKTRLGLTLPLLSHFGFRQVLLAFVLKCFFFLRFSMCLIIFECSYYVPQIAVHHWPHLFLLFSFFHREESNKAEFIASLLRR